MTLRGLIEAVDRPRCDRISKAAARMMQHHRDVCEQEGDHPAEVDTFYSLAADALHFHRAAILRALDDQRGEGE